MLMFFYGRFRADGDLAFLLTQRGCTVLGDRSVTGYSLWSTRDGRGVFARPAPGNPIKGQLWDVPDHVVDFVDECEGHPDNYRRETTLTDQQEECWIYVMQHPIEAFTVRVEGEWTPETIRAALMKT